MSTVRQHLISTAVTFAATRPYPWRWPDDDDVTARGTQAGPGPSAGLQASGDWIVKHVTGSSRDRDHPWSFRICACQPGESRSWRQRGRQASVEPWPQAGGVPEGGVLSKSHLSPGNLRRLRIKAIGGPSDRSCRARGIRIIGHGPLQLAQLAPGLGGRSARSRERPRRGRCQRAGVCS